MYNQKYFAHKSYESWPGKQKFMLHVQAFILVWLQSEVSFRIKTQIKWNYKIQLFTYSIAWLSCWNVHYSQWRRKDFAVTWRASWFMVSLHGIRVSLLGFRVSLHGFSLSLHGFSLSLPSPKGEPAWPLRRASPLHGGPAWPLEVGLHGFRVGLHGFRVDLHGSGEGLTTTEWACMDPVIAILASVWEITAAGWDATAQDEDHGFEDHEALLLWAELPLKSEILHCSRLGFHGSLWSPLQRSRWAFKAPGWTLGCSNFDFFFENPICSGIHW